MYLFQLGARRQLDFDLSANGTQVLANLNRLAETELTSRPVHDTSEHYLGHVAVDGWERLRCQMVQHLQRMQVLDAARLLGYPVLLIDATGLLCFPKRHCAHCLEQKHGDKVVYLHHVLEAKLLGPAGLVISLGSEFIENADAGEVRGRSAEEVKQDCELKALARLAPRIKQQYPQWHFVLAWDNLYACGPGFAVAADLGWSYVATFKEGRTPALWREYEALREASPADVRRRDWADRPAQEFRWVPRLDYVDSAGRAWQPNALECRERGADGQEHYFAWLTDLPVNRKTVEEIAQKGGAVSLEDRE